jgi:cytolysin-activating lysine-acyltransferase
LKNTRKTTMENSKAVSAEQPTAPQDISQAKAALAKLPMLGPIMWLYARDANKRWSFVAEQDWLLIPPLVLDQCKLYTKQEIPWAYCSWAKVSDPVHARLQSGQAKIGPAEWQSGSNCWLIDLVAPFGEADKILDDLRRTSLKGIPVYRHRANAVTASAAYERLEAL